MPKRAGAACSRAMRLVATAALALACIARASLRCSAEARVKGQVRR